jgi:hypothetical protein
MFKSPRKLVLLLKYCTRAKLQAIGYRTTKIEQHETLRIWRLRSRVRIAAAISSSNPKTRYHFCFFVQVNLPFWICMCHGDGAWSVFWLAICGRCVILGGFLRESFAYSTPNWMVCSASFKAQWRVVKYVLGGGRKSDSYILVCSNFSCGRLHIVAYLHLHLNRKAWARSCSPWFSVLLPFKVARLTNAIGFTETSKIVSCSIRISRIRYSKGNKTVHEAESEWSRRLWKVAWNRAIQGV